MAQGTIVGVVERERVACSSREEETEEREEERKRLEETGRGRNYRGLCFAYGPTGPSAE